MIKNDNMQAKMTVLQMENVRLTNEIARLNGYVAFVEEENHNIERETREECRQELEMALMERDRAVAMAESARKEAAKGGKGLTITTRCLRKPGKPLLKEIRRMPSLKGAYPSLNPSRMQLPWQRRPALMPRRL